MPQQLLDRIHQSKRIVLSTHQRPDGDAVGSQLAMGMYLEAIGKDVLMLNADRAPYSLEWMPGIDRLKVFDGSMSLREAVGKADLLLVLDTNGEKRLGAVGPLFRASGVETALIDHHTNPESWFDLAYQRENVSSTGQLIHEIIHADNPDLIDTAIATALYVAIMTDTGSFRFSNVTSTVHRVIADLIERGNLDVSSLHSEVYDKKSLGGVRLLSRVLQSITLDHDGQLAHMTVSRNFLKETAASVEETDGFVNWGLAIEGVRVALIFTETERGTKVSFRSKGNDHVHRWAQSLGGGGHPNASGAFVRAPLAETIRRVVRQTPRFIALRSASDSDDSTLSADDEAYLSLLNAHSRSS